MERRLHVRILSWRAGRLARSGRGALLLLLIALFAVATVVVPRLDLVSQTYTSACIPYTVRLPRAWRVQPVALPECGSPVLSDEYHLLVQGEQLTLRVQAVSLSSGRYPNLSNLPQTIGGIRRRAGDGQIYTLFLEQDNEVMTANASFNRPPFDYQVTVESGVGIDPERALIQVMDGWGAAPVVKNPAQRAEPARGP